MFTLGKQNDDELSSGLRIIYNKSTYIHTLSYIYIVIFYIICIYIYICVKFTQLIWVAHDSKHLTNEIPISVVRKNPPGRRAAVQVHGVSEVAIRRGPGPRLECPIFLGECWWILWKMLVLSWFFPDGLQHVMERKCWLPCYVFSCWLCWKMFNDMFRPMFTMAGAWWYHPKLEGFMAMDSPWWHINHIIGLSINGGTPIAGWFLSWKNL